MSVPVNVINDLVCPAVFFFHATHQGSSSVVVSDRLRELPGDRSS